MGDPLFFESAGFRLFGVLDPGAAPRTGAGVVFCQPFAEEKQLTDRVYVRFAQQLVAAGFATLRFDARGHGESAGDLVDDTLDGQIVDTLAAIALLKDRLAVRDVVLLGLRLGGTTAALTAARAAEPMSIVLWSPVIQGHPYVRELLRKKLAAQLAQQEAAGTREDLVAALQQEGFIEFEGGRLTRAMFDQLSAVDLLRDVPGATGTAFISTIRQRNRNGGPCAALADAYRRAGTTCDLVVAEEREYWDVRSMFDGVFPEDLYRVTLECLAARWPRTA